jgi:hypothetical protein
LEVISAEARGCCFPLKFLIASRPEIEITATFNSKALHPYSTRLDLNASVPDIRHFLNGTFQKIKATHPLKRYIQFTWPPNETLEKLVKTASSQFIYASTVARFIATHPSWLIECHTWVAATDLGQRQSLYRT